MIDLSTVLVIASVLFGLITGYREVLILVDRGSWSWISFKHWLYWFTNQSGKKKNYDSFHFSNGVAFLFISIAFSYAIYLQLNLSFWYLPINTIFFWLFKFYIRNIAMHILIPKWERGNRQLKLYYLIPLIGKFLQKRYERSKF